MKPQPTICDHINPVFDGGIIKACKFKCSSNDDIYLPQSYASYFIHEKQSCTDKYFTSITLSTLISVLITFKRFLKCYKELCFNSNEIENKYLGFIFKTFTINSKLFNLKQTERKVDGE